MSGEILEEVNVQTVTIKNKVPEVDTSFKFQDRKLVSMDQTNIMAATSLNNINPEYLKANKLQAFTELVLEKEQYKDRDHMDLGGYTQEYVDRAIKVLKAFYGLKKTGIIYAYTGINVPIVLTTETERDSKTLAIVIAPRVNS